MRTTTKKLENAVTQIKVTFDKKEWAEAHVLLSVCVIKMRRWLVKC